MEDEYRELSSLKEWDKNPKNIKVKDFQRLKRQIKRLGKYKPLLIMKDGTVLGGNMRTRALKEIGVESVRTTVIEFHYIEGGFYSTINGKRDGEGIFNTIEDGMLEYALSDNDRAGFYDDDLLANLIPNYNVDFSEYAVDLRAPETLDGWLDTDEVIEDEAPPLPKKAISKHGELYQLGKHILLCGDSTDEKSVERLMGGGKADIVFTDPPYNIGWDYDDRGRNRFGSKSGVSKVYSEGVFKDSWTPDEYIDFLYKAYLNAYNHTKDIMTIYAFHGGKYQNRTVQALEKAGFHYSQNIIWVKERMIPMPGQLYHHLYEGLAVAWKKGKGKYRNLNFNLEDVFAVGYKRFIEFIKMINDVWWEKRDILNTYEHPTQKPVRLAERAIKVSCPKDGSVLDLFGGSGSTLIACEQMDRKCYMMELDPKFCDVIRKRYAIFKELGEDWEKATPIIKS